MDYIKEASVEINVYALEPGTKLKVQTCNNTYHIEILPGKGDVLIQGGKYFPEPQVVYYNAAIWDNDCYKIGKLGYGASMEVIRGSGSITTSKVQSIEINGERVPPPDDSVQLGGD